MKLKSGELKNVKCIPTSVRTKEQAESLKIPLITLNEMPKGTMLDVAIDGADAVDPDMCLVKGGGGALLREKMVEVMSKKVLFPFDITCQKLDLQLAKSKRLTPKTNGSLSALWTRPSCALASALRSRCQLRSRPSVTSTLFA